MLVPLEVLYRTAAHKKVEEFTGTQLRWSLFIGKLRWVHQFTK